MNIMKNFLSFERRPCIIAIFALLIVIVILYVGNQSFKATENATLKEFNQRQLAMARGVTGGIELFFETLAGAARAIGSLPEVNQFDETITRKLLALEIQELETLGVNDIGVLDANGVVRYTVMAPKLEGADFSWRRYFKEAKEMTSSASYIIQFIEFKGVEAGQKGILIAVPMFETPEAQRQSSSGSSGKFAGVVLCTLKLDTLTKRFIVPVKSSERGHAFLVDDRFNVLWFPDRSFFGKNLLKEAVGFPSFQQILERMDGEKSGTGEYTYYGFNESTGKFTNVKEEKLIAHVPIRLGKERWAIGVWAPRKDAKRLIRSTYIKHLLLLGIIIITVVLGSSYAILLSSRYNKTQEREVEIKTRELKESHQRLLTVLDSLDAAVHVSDMETYEILFANRYLTDLFGDVVGRICWQTLHAGKSGPCNVCTNEKLVTSDGKPAGVNVRELNNAVIGKWFEIRERAIPWVDGRIVKLEIAADINDRKIAEEELKRAHHEMETFCRILKHIGVQRTLDGIGSFLMKEFKAILNSPYTLLYVFSGSRDILFTLSDRGTSTIKDQELIQTASDILDNLDGITISPKEPFKPPLIPDDFPVPPKGGRQTIIPLRTQNHVEGAFLAACPLDCLCDEKALNMIDLILDQASGTLKRAVSQQEEIQELQGRIESTAEFSGIIGKDPKMQMTYKLIEDISPTDSTILIQGESGTGKELVASALHRQSLRKDKPFVVINCSAYPSTLLESELFGHEKGAFTGALRQKSGRFEQAHGGTVFLDEIGEISPSAQIKLLRVLQTQKFERLGGEQTLAVDVRILAATNKNLLEEVKKRNFREDLFYRLNVIPIVLPPLKDRPNDIPLLAQHFLRRFASQQEKNIKGFSSNAMKLLLDCPWPGNVRELENSIEHATVLTKDSRIRLSDLPSALLKTHASSQVNGSRGTMMENEIILLQEVLAECEWNKKQAASRLGISRSALYNKLKKYQIAKPAIV